MNAAFPHSDALGIGAVTDPNTDLTYFAVGKSILYFGGIESTLTGNDSKVSEFIPASKAWSTLLTKGLGPPPRVEHCAAANDDGTRMVVYGGRYATTPVTGAIYVLNTITGDWVTGAPGPARMNPVCTIAGDQFLIWGGQDGTGNLGDGIPMLIYNFATNQWVSNYVPPPSYSKPTTSLPTSTSTSGTAPSSIPTTVEPEKPSNNLPLILGGILGVLVLVLLIIGYILYRRRQQRKEREGKNDQEKKMVISAPTMTDFDEPGDFRGPGYGPGVNEGYREQAPYSKLAGPHGSIKAGRLRGEVDFDAVPGFNQPSARSNPHTTTSAKPAHRRGPEALANEKMMAEDTYEEEDDGVVFEKNLKNIENQQRQLDLRRQLLVLQQQQGQQVTRSAPQQGSPDNPVLQHPQVQQVSRSAPQEGSPVNSESGHWEMLIPPSRGPQRVHGTTADYHPPPPPPPVKRSRVDYPPPPPTVQAYALGSQVSNGNGYDYGGGYGYGDDNSPMPPSYHGGHNPQAIV
ncbi:hypothetical protein BGW39_007561 [Mortierella sp. 14UC]|nr:hypothetical protein BGW39_007561 [Mortierella sp. 14UC]